MTTINCSLIMSWDWEELLTRLQIKRRYKGLNSLVLFDILERHITINQMVSVCSIESYGVSKIPLDRLRHTLSLLSIIKISSDIFFQLSYWKCKLLILSAPLTTILLTGSKLSVIHIIDIGPELLTFNSKFIEWSLYTFGSICSTNFTGAETEKRF